MPPTPRLFIAGLLGAAALTACGGDGTDDTAPDTTGPAVTGADAVVVVDDVEFQPEQLSISTDDTVAWTFQDRVDHDVAFDDGPASPVQRDGTWTRTFDELGTYDYVCTLHPSMTGTVTVTA